MRIGVGTGKTYFSEFPTDDRINDTVLNLVGQIGAVIDGDRFPKWNDDRTSWVSTNGSPPKPSEFLLAHISPEVR